MYKHECVDVLNFEGYKIAQAIHAKYCEKIAENDQCTGWLLHSTMQESVRVMTVDQSVLVQGDDNFDLAWKLLKQGDDNAKTD